MSLDSQVTLFFYFFGGGGGGKSQDHPGYEAEDVLGETAWNAED